MKASFRVRLLVGSDAASALTRFVGSAPPFVEALLYRAATNEVVFDQKLGRGYGQFDDWSMFDTDAAFTSVAEAVEADSRRRQQAGLSSIHVVRWLEAPVLDRSTNSMHWAIEALDDRGQPVVTAVVLIFGRDGFEKLTWGGRTLHPNDNLLQVTQASFSFPPGGRYGDYEDGDSIAIYGLADTVAIVLGAKRATK